MQVGCSLLVAKDLETAMEAGFDYVEFMGKYLVGLTDKEFGKLLEKVQKSSVKVLGINGYCPESISMAGPDYDEEKIRNYAKSCTVRAAALGVSFAGIGSPKSRNLPKGFSEKTAMIQLKKFLTITAEEFGRFGITVCLEALAPCYCNFINYLSEAISVAEDLKLDNLKVVLDFYNMEHVKEAEMDLCGLEKWIAHSHISDDDGAPNKRYYLKKEKSDVHQRRIRNLYRAGYQGAITLEMDCRTDLKLAAQSLQIIKASLNE